MPWVARWMTANCFEPVVGSQVVEDLLAGVGAEEDVLLVEQIGDGQDLAAGARQSREG